MAQYKCKGRRSKADVALHSIRDAGFCMASVYKVISQARMADASPVIKSAFQLAERKTRKEKGMFFL